LLIIRPSLEKKAQAKPVEKKPEKVKEAPKPTPVVAEKKPKDSKSVQVSPIEPKK